MAGRVVRHDIGSGPSLGPFAALALALISAVALGGLSCRSSPNTVPIGAYLPLSGPLASFGASTRNGVEMALQEINSAGGLDGKLLEVTFVDDEGDPERARDAARRLIENSGVALIIGGTTSGTSLAAAPICQAQGVPMLSPSSTNPAVTEIGDFIARVCYVDSFQGTAMATFAHNSLRLGRVAVMTKMGDGYSEGLAEYFIRTFEELDGEVVAEVPVPESPLRVDDAVRAALAENPEAIYLPLYYQDVAIIARNVAESGGTVSLLGGDGWDSPELLELAGEVLDGGYFSTHFSSQDRRTKVRTFVRMYREMYDTTPDATAALGYDALHLVASALARLAERFPSALETLCWAGADGGGRARLSVARIRLRDEIVDMTGLDGVTGEITIGPSRNALKPAVVLQVKNGEIVYAGVVRP